MNWKKSVSVISLVCIILLCSCGNREVIYTEESSEPDKENVSEQNIQCGLRDVLGVENDSRWQDVFKGNNQSSYEIDAHITFPEVDYLYTVKAEKRYFTGEDKERLTSVFFDEGSLRINTEYSSKEDLQNAKDTLIEAKNNGQRLVLGTNKTYESYEYYLDYLMELSDLEKQNEAAISDYSANCYIGEKNGMEYKIDFFADDTINNSGFRIARAQDLGVFTERFGEVGSAENVCQLSYEDAEKEAVEILKDLDLPPMQMTEVFDLCQWYVNDAGYERRDVNGYYFHFSRVIEGVAVDNHPYYSIPTETIFPENYPYLREFVDIGIDDGGLVFLNAGGLLTKGEVTQVNHILPFESIRDVVESAFWDYDTESIKIKEISLVYLRVENSDNTESFQYIPVWRVSPYYVDNVESVCLDDLIFINAIDGTIVSNNKNDIMTNTDQIMEMDRLTYQINEMRMIRNIDN